MSSAQVDKHLDDKVESAPVAAAEKTETTEKAKYIKQHNVIIVRKTTRFKSLVIQTKNLLKNRFETIELHGVDDQSFLTISLVAQCLLKYKYVTLSRLKTKTHQTILKRDDEKKPSKDDNDADNRVILQPKLVVHLTKTPDFDSIYDDFEAAFKKIQEEHAEDISEIEKSAVKAEADEGKAEGEEA